MNTTLLNVLLALGFLAASSYLQKPDVSLLAIVAIVLIAMHRLVANRESAAYDVAEDNQPVINFWYFLKILFAVAIGVTYAVIIINLLNNKS